MIKIRLNMDAIEFVNEYQNFLYEIESIIKPELLPALQELKETDAEDIISADSWFLNENQARGFVLKLFLKKCNI
ncbi:MAG: hypothetical protein PHS59_07135 [Paludibacter sp.]|nr:hypothetical protein [Paludibacter sp.]